MSTLPPPALGTQQRTAAEYFVQLQGRIITALEALEQQYALLHSPPEEHPVGQFTLTPWQREDKHHPDNISDGVNTPNEVKAPGGGGTMGVMRGHLFAKAGVNFSEVYGHFDARFRSEIPGAGDSGAFWASGVSLVIHPRNPWVPIVHMNIRMIATEQRWFGGGIDLTPALPIAADSQEFHQKLQACCDQFDPAYYPRFKQHCDEYFYLPHRQEARGVGGIFIDNLASSDLAQDWAFIQAISDTFIDCYAPIVQRHWQRDYGANELAAQRHKRSRYVEFNLLWDRGTRFGMMTGGNTEAILMSLPPDAGWE